MQEQECFPNNTFSDSVPDIDTCCGCIDDYDLTDWNDTPPIDGEDGSYNPMPQERRRGEPCIYVYPECQNCTRRKNTEISEDIPPVAPIDTPEIQPESNSYNIIDL